MSTAAPPAWVRQLRSPGLTATLKYMLIVLWGWGDFQRKGPKEPDGGNQPAKPKVVWACRETLARESGQALGTVKNQLAKLVELGWIRREKNGSKTLMAWREPHGFAYGWPETEPRWPDTEPALNGATAAPNQAAVAQDQATEWPGTEPHNFKGTSNNLPTELEEEAREPLPPPPKPRPAQTSLVTGKPSAAQRSAQAQLERERAAVRAKFSGPPSDVLTAVMLEAVDHEHRDAWVQEAAGGEYGSWSTAMGERARKLGLTREALGVAVLASWERECAEHPPGVKPGQPDRGELWYGKHSAWLRKAAGLGESTIKPEATKRSPNGQAAFDAVMAKVKARKLAVVT